MKDIQQSHLQYLGGVIGGLQTGSLEQMTDWKTRRVGGKQGEMKAVFDDLL